MSNEPEPVQQWPAWYYHPDGSAKIFNTGDELTLGQAAKPGWRDTPFPEVPKATVEQENAALKVKIAELEAVAVVGMGSGKKKGGGE